MHARCETCWRRARPSSAATADNCSGTANADQADDDRDFVGNVCDNCPGTANPLQEDGDADPAGEIAAIPQGEAKTIGR